MKIAFVFLLFALPSMAQNVRPFAAACGPQEQHLQVVKDNNNHTPADMETGKARIIFINQLVIDATLIGHYTEPIGMDGAWVGANHNNSWFSIAVEPGEHHFCSLIDQRFDSGGIELLHLNVEAHKTYYVRSRFLRVNNTVLHNFDLIDSDQGAYLVSIFPKSEVKVKK